MIDHQGAEVPVGERFSVVLGGHFDSNSKVKIWKIDPSSGAIQNGKNPVFDAALFTPSQAIAAITYVKMDAPTRHFVFLGSTNTIAVKCTLTYSGGTSFSLTKDAVLIFNLNGVEDIIQVDATRIAATSDAAIIRIIDI